MTAVDDFPLAARTRKKPPREIPCNHATCTGCKTCSCHAKPKTAPVEPATVSEARAVGARLTLALVRSERFLLALSQTNRKTQPVSRVEEAVIRGHDDLDAVLRSPSLNGAVSGGDDPSWRMLDSITTKEVFDADGNVVSGGDLRDRFDATAATLAELVDTILQIERLAATAMSAVDDLRALPATQARKLAESDSDVQHCVHCGKVVTGTRDDPLRAGRCGACYTYRLRNHSDRPLDLVEKEQARKVAQGGATP